MMSDVISTGPSVLFNEFFEKLQKLFAENKPPEIQKVVVKQDPDEYSNTVLDKVSTTNKKWADSYPHKPDLVFENVLEKESIVKEISLMPDIAFSTKGKIMITIDDVDVFKSQSFDAFENIQDTVIKIRKTIQKDSKVKVFMISSDGSAVAMTLQVTFGE